VYSENVSWHIKNTQSTGKQADCIYALVHTWGAFQQESRLVDCYCLLYAIALWVYFL